MSDAEAPQYGLPTPRNNDGERQPVDFTYTYDGEEVTIRVIEPTVAELAEYEDLGEETSYDRLFEIIDTHVVKPSFESQDDLTGRELLCYLAGIRQVGYLGGTDLAEDANDALEERDGGPGN